MTIDISKWMAATKRQVAERDKIRDQLRGEWAAKYGLRGCLRNRDLIAFDSDSENRYAG